MPKNAEIFTCETCDFKCNKKSNFTTHCSTRKHILSNNWKPNGNQTIIPNAVLQFVCIICSAEYKNRSGLWKHQQKCKPVENKLLNENNDIKIQDDSSKSSVGLSNETVIRLIEKNQELQDLLIEQNSKIIELSSQHRIINNITNNNQFNLNMFLNEQCKDALNLMDFINNLQIEFKDVEYVGTHGFVEGISKIFMNGLKQLDIYKRPIHCTDLKRETLYIKEDDKWEKDTTDKGKIIKAITNVANKNIKRISTWYKAHPECDIHDSSAYNLHLNIMKQSMGGSSYSEMDKNNEKIVKNIAKQVLLNRQSFTNI